MQNLFNHADYFDEDYFEHGIETGKSYYTNYHYIPERSKAEAEAIIRTFSLRKEKDFILDYGTAKGFLVRAFRDLGYAADGCDISEYALSFAPDGCWSCLDRSSYSFFSYFGYTHVIAKDVLEHISEPILCGTLLNIAKLSKNFLCVIPMGDNGKYRIPEYHLDPSHLIAENESWWRKLFVSYGWNIKQEFDHIDGIKDNWYSVNPSGNRVFILERQ